MVLSKSETQDSGYYGSSKTMLLWIMQAHYDFQQQKIEMIEQNFLSAYCLLVEWNESDYVYLWGQNPLDLKQLKDFVPTCIFRELSTLNMWDTILIGKLCIMQRNFCIYRYSLLFPFGSKFFKSVNLKNLKDIFPSHLLI